MWVVKGEGWDGGRGGRGGGREGIDEVVGFVNSDCLIDSVISASVNPAKYRRLKYSDHY